GKPGPASMPGSHTAASTLAARDASDSPWRSSRALSTPSRRLRPPVSSTPATPATHDTDLTVSSASMEPGEMRDRVDTAMVARLATLRPDGAPHVVPVCFARVGDTIVSIVDAKP